MRGLLKAAAVAGSAALALAAVEFLLLRGAFGYHGIEDADVYRHDAELGWVLRPNAAARSSNLEFAFAVRTDDLGLRTGEHQADWRASPRRVLLVGDSFAFGWGVGDDEMLSARLQAAFDAHGLEAAVLNGGVPGYSTDQEYLLWQRLDGLVHPALVIVLMGSNDPPADNASSVRMGEASYSKPRFRVATSGGIELGGVPVPDKEQVIVPTALEPIKARTRRFAAYALARRFRDARYAPAAPAPPVEDAAALGTTAAILVAFNRRVREEGASLLVALIPSPDISAALAGICRTAGIPFLDLAAAFAGRDDLVFKYDGHWNARGHQAAADAIAPAAETMLR